MGVKRGAGPSALGPQEQVVRIVAPTATEHDVAGAGPGGTPLRPFVPVDPDKGVFSDNPYANEIAHFADCCRDGKEPISSGRDNLGTMKIIFGIYESSRTGQVVDLDKL